MKRKKIIGPIVAGTVLGTSTMTFFSYVLSDGVREQFREPQLLNEFLQRSGFPVTQKSLIGWELHYLVGLGFVIVYHQFWKNITPRIIAGATFGVVSGIVGVAFWKTLFRFHPNPPPAKRFLYFLQLIPAHILFGMFAAIGYRHLRGRMLK